MLGVNSLIADLTTAEQRLILWVSVDGSYGYWHNLTSSSRTPLKFDVVEVMTGITEEKYESSAFAITPRPEESVSIKERLYRDKNWSVIREIVDKEPEIYEKHQRSQLLRRASEMSGIKANNIYAFLDRYWRAGKSKNGLLPLYSNCGAKGKARKEVITSTDVQATTHKKSGKALTDADLPTLNAPSASII